MRQGAMKVLVISLVAQVLSGCRTPCAEGANSISIGLEVEGELVDPLGSALVLEERGDERGVRIGWQASGPAFDRVMRDGKTSVHYQAIRWINELEFVEIFRGVETSVPECSASGGVRRYERRDYWVPVEDDPVEDYLYGVSVIFVYPLDAPYVHPVTGFGFRIAEGP